MRQQILVSALGVALTAVPGITTFPDAAGDLARIAGPMLAALGCIGAFDVTRPLRWAAIPIAILAACTSVVPPFFAWSSTPIIIAVGGAAVWLTFATPYQQGSYGAGAEDAAERSSTPPGWSYNPSSWTERLPLVGVALLGFVTAGYLAAFQFGWIHTVWDPFFGRGTERILTSGVSRLLPIPDAALGALGYLVDAVSAIIGGRNRWRTMPWIVIVFGIAVGPLGAVSVLLVILQPIAFHAWCTLCLTSAVVSIVMIGPSMDEVLAGMQHVVRLRRRGASWWDGFLGRDVSSRA